MPKFPPMLILIAAALLLNGCATDEPTAIFNPQAIYHAPPSGLWVSGLIDEATAKNTGAIWIFPGTTIFYESSEIK